jgi:hypothetical protein
MWPVPVGTVSERVVNASAAARAAAVGFAGVALFQAALALGVGWGSNPGTLPVGLRLTSAVAAVVWLAVALVVGGVVRVGRRFRRAVITGLLPAMVVSAVLNAISPSALERSIWTPVVVLQLVLLWTARRRERRG